MIEERGDVHGAVRVVRSGAVAGQWTAVEKVVGKVVHPMLKAGPLLDKRRGELDHGWHDPVPWVEARCFSVE